MTQKQFPGIDDNVHYTEGAHFGYRWYEQHAVKPAFAFGHGLSYTEFSYNDLVVDWNTVSLKVTNIGDRAGQEVVQLYLSAPKTENLYGKYHSKMNLKNFAKIHLEPNETKVVQLELTDRDFSFWDVVSKSWKVEHGQYTVHVGSASDDIRVSTKIDV